MYLLIPTQCSGEHDLHEILIIIFLRILPFLSIYRLKKNIQQKHLVSKKSLTVLICSYES